MSDSKKSSTRFNSSFGLSRHNWFLIVFLIVATLFVYWPALHGEFLWDDDSWTTKLEPLFANFHGLAQIWLEPTSLQQYYPLAATSFWIDYHLWNFSTFPYHVENVLLHALAAILFVQLLSKLRVPGAFLAGAIFALHPVMVESAAWITERKNVLSLVFYLGSLLVYGKLENFWIASGEDLPLRQWFRQNWPRYVLAFALFIAALLAKITAFSLPASILLICWWKRGRIRWRNDVLPLAPWFAASVGLGFVISWLEKHHVGAGAITWSLTFPQRCIVAGHVVWFYLVKLLWPVDLCFVYPRWTVDSHSIVQWCFPVGAILTLFGLLLARERIGRGPAAAALFFVGTLFPVLGFLNAYFMRFSFVCDHWVYLSSLGLIALFSALVTRGCARLPRPALAWTMAIILILPLAALARRQTAMYTDNETLYKKILADNPKSIFALNNLGTLAEQKGQLEEAVTLFRRSLSLDPTFSSVYVNLGQALCNQGKMDEAATVYQQGLKAVPADPDIHNSYGVLLNARGQSDEAMAHFQKSIEADPNFAAAHNNLAIAFINRGDTNEAIAHFQKAAELDPEDPNVHGNLGKLLLADGQYGRAISQLEKSLELRPDYPDTLTDLAWLLSVCPDASLRNGAKAVELAKRADRVAQGSDFRVNKTMAAAYGESGQFSNAVACAQKALALLPTNAMPEIEQLQSQIKLYQSGRPFHLP